MALAKQFNRRLNDLWRLRTANIDSLLGKRTGRPRHFTKKARDRGLRKLRDLANTILTKQGAKIELAHVTAYTKRRQIRGHGIGMKFDRIIRWSRKNFDDVAIIYSFWRGKKCLYVGKGKSWKRLRSYRRDDLLNKATLLKVRAIKGESHLGKAECLAHHLDKPGHNIIKPARTKWGKGCPVCKAMKEIKNDLKSLFHLK